MNEAIDIKETRPAVVHLVALSTVDPDRASGTLNFQGQEFVVDESQAIHQSKVIRESAYSKGGGYDDLVADIFRAVLPYESIDNNAHLNSEQKIELQGKLQDEFETGKVVYFTVPFAVKEHTLNKVENIRRLKYEFPHLVVIRAGVNNVSSLLLADISERRITDLMKKFADL